MLERHSGTDKRHRFMHIIYETDDVCVLFYTSMLIFTVLIWLSNQMISITLICRSPPIFLSFLLAVILFSFYFGSFLFFFFFKTPLLFFLCPSFLPSTFPFYDFLLSILFIHSSFKKKMKENKERIWQGRKKTRQTSEWETHLLKRNKRKRSRRITFRKEENQTFQSFSFLPFPPSLHSLILSVFFHFPSFHYLFLGVTPPHPFLLCLFIFYHPILYFVLFI